MVNAVDQEQILMVLGASTIPVVMIDCLATPVLPSVSVDNVEGAYLATCHLIQRGHQRIAHISGASTMEITRQRTQGYFNALSDHDLPYHQVVAQKDDPWSYRAGYDAMLHLLQCDPIPRAVFAAADEIAIGAYRALVENALSVPHEMSVVGFDDIEAATFASPPLTTVRQPFAALASSAVSLLFEIINGRQEKPLQITLSPELVVRQSIAEAL